MQLTQYRDTYIWYLNGVVSGIYFLLEPVLMMFVFDQMNNSNPATIAWFVILWALSIYSLFLTVADMQIQVLMLNLQVYVKGITLMMLLTNLFQFGANFYYWMAYMQDQLLKD